MLYPDSFEQVTSLIADRLADARHTALVQEALAAPGGAHRGRSGLRLRLASSLRDLAWRLDPSSR
jgi:hypothetical protein